MPAGSEMNHQSSIVKRSLQLHFLFLSICARVVDIETPSEQFLTTVNNEL